MALLYDKVISTVSKSPCERTDGMIEQILPWFRKKSELFNSQKTEIVKDILKNCQFQKCQRDFVIIKQGEKGDCFYIILSGSVAIHIQTNLGEDGIQYDPASHAPNLFGKKKDLDRSLFGNFVGKIPAGRSFGELALINTDCVRNASIIADEVTDLIIVNRDLYNSTLKSFQEKEFNEKKKFVEEYPLFKNWQVRYKKQLAMSLRKEKITFDGLVVKQGAPVDGMCFLLSGEAKMLVDPVQHELQYPDKFPVPDVQELEKVEARESIRREMNMSVTKTDDRKYARARSPNLLERKKSHKSLEMCVIGAIELIGDLELTFGLPSYAETCQCTEGSEVFVLDQKNFERLVEKRNPHSIEIMRQNLLQKLKLRVTWIQKELPLFRYFLYKLEEKQRSELKRLRTSHKRRDARPDYWKSGKIHNGPLIDMFGPGSVFYTIRMRNRNKGLLRGDMGINGPSRNQIGAYLARKSGHRSHAVDIREMVRKQFSNDRDQDRDQDDENEENEPVFATEVNGGAILGRSDEDSETDDVDGPRRPRQTTVLCENVVNGSSKATGKKKKALAGCSVDDFMNQELNNLTLSKLESRIQEWHTKVDDIERDRRPKSAKSHLVKLHRYSAEDNRKPMPGTKIVFKPKVRPQPTGLALHLESVVVDTNEQQTPPQSAGGISITRSRDIASRDCERDSWLVPDKSVDYPDGRKWCTKRPLSSKSEMCISPTVQIRRRPKSARNYTAEDYVILKEELRRKQIAYKSLLARSNTVF